MNFEKAENFIWKHGRLLERRIFEYCFFQGSKDNVLASLKAYQNDDGGFGNALEPDLRGPESQPLHMEFALWTLYDCNIKELEMSFKACEYVSKHADLITGIPTIFESSIDYPHASHWDNSLSTQPSTDRLTGLVGLLNWQGINHPWLDLAVDSSLENILNKKNNDAHTILTSFCLLESLPQTEQIIQLFDKLSTELLTNAKFLRMDAYSQNYGLSPLEFAPSPSSYCNRIFSKDTIIQHLKVLMSQQSDDGGWLISWEPPSETAKLEWRARLTLKNLMLLERYKEIIDLK